MDAVVNTEIQQQNINQDVDVDGFTSPLFQTYSTKKQPTALIHTSITCFGRRKEKSIGSRALVSEFSWKFDESDDESAMKTYLFDNFHYEAAIESCSRTPGSMLYEERVWRTFVASQMRLNNKKSTDRAYLPSEMQKQRPTA